MKKVVLRDPQTKKRIFADVGPSVYSGILDSGGVPENPESDKSVFHFGVDWDWRLTRSGARAVQSHPLGIDDVPELADLKSATLERLEDLGKIPKGSHADFNNCTVTVFPPGTGRAPMCENSLRVPCDQVDPGSDDWMDDVDHNVVTQVVSVWLRLPRPPHRLHSDSVINIENISAESIRGAGVLKSKEIGAAIPYTILASNTLVKFNSLYRARVLSKLKETRDQEGVDKKKKKAIKREIDSAKRKAMNNRKTRVDIPEMIIVETFAYPLDITLPLSSGRSTYFEDGDVSVGDANAIVYPRQVRKRMSTEARIDENGNFVGWGSYYVGFKPEFLSERPPDYNHNRSDHMNAIERTLPVRMARATWMEVTFRAINVEAARKANERRHFARRNYVPAP